eukprot:416126-Pelagomonas_calceolata.AAC.1
MVQVQTEGTKERSIEENADQKSFNLIQETARHFHYLLAAIMISCLKDLMRRNSKSFCMSQNLLTNFRSVGRLNACE